MGSKQALSIVRAALEFKESIIGSVNCRERILGLFNGLPKAFDSVAHSILTDRLYTVCLVCYVVLASYLINGKQYIQLSQIVSN